MSPLPAGALYRAGLLGSLDQVASARSSRSGGDRGHPQRAVDVRVLDGIDLRLLPDRGLDIASAWYAGRPLAWVSRVGEVGPLPAPRGADWNTAFGGGLLTTCGLQNVGAPSEGHGQHGTFSHLPARDLRIDRDVEGDEVVVSVRAVIDDVDALGTHLRCERLVRTTTGRGEVMVRDVVTNLGAEAVAAPFLYHVNLGAPLWSPGARLEVASREVVPRDAVALAAMDSWAAAPQPAEGAPERVFEHLVAPDDRGWCTAAVVNPAAGIRLEVGWDGRTLPRLHQWVHPAAGVNVLGVEPANCSVLGRAADRAAGTLPMLGAGDSRTTTISVRVSSVSPDRVTSQ
jgi:Domain of unknown function (DUF4432)